MKKNKLKLNVIFMLFVFVSAIVINVGAAVYSDSSSYHSIYYRDDIYKALYSTHYSQKGGTTKRAMLNTTGNYEHWEMGDSGLNGPSTIFRYTNQMHLHAYGTSVWYPENVR